MLKECVILSRYHEQETLQRFTQDVLIDGAVTLVSLGRSDMQQILTKNDGFDA